MVSLLASAHTPSRTLTAPHQPHNTTTPTLTTNNNQPPTKQKTGAVRQRQGRPARPRRRRRDPRRRQGARDGRHADRRLAVCAVLVHARPVRGADEVDGLRQRVDAEALRGRRLVLAAADLDAARRERRGVRPPLQGAVDLMSHMHYPPQLFNQCGKPQRLNTHTTDVMASHPCCSNPLLSSVLFYLRSPYTPLFGCAALARQRVPDTFSGGPKALAPLFLPAAPHRPSLRREVLLCHDARALCAW